MKNELSTFVALLSTDKSVEQAQRTCYQALRMMPQYRIVIEAVYELWLKMKGLSEREGGEDE